ncbi:carboxylesterase [Winogradskya consettensis]|uniref:Carboxylesterase n=2 Tax=Winogradskya consettensis TaxID=113560 RepID=A0A919VYI8_9ACTN|nr:carboxylesterase [Actinoplanes consettensis]
MYHENMAAILSAFTSDDARERYLATVRRLIERYWPVERTEKHVPTSFGDTFVIRSGGGDGVPFFLLPGSGGGCVMWYPYVAELGRDRPVYAVDPVGEPGQSTQTAPITGGADWSRWLTDVLDGLGLDRVHLVGTSYGAWVALQHELDSPGRAASITIVDPGGFGRVTRRFMTWIMLSGLASFTPRPVRHRAARLLNNATLKYDDVHALVGGLFRFRRRLPMPGTFTDEELRRIETPTLALFGERSQMLDAGAVAARMRSLLPDVRTVVVPDAGHDLILHSPELIAGEIRGFTAQRPGGQTKEGSRR